MMRRTVEPPDAVLEGDVALDQPADEAPAAPTGMASCDNPAEALRTEAVDIADATGVHLEAAPPTPKPKRWKAILGIVTGAVILGGLSAAFLFFPIDWDAVGSWGYLGVFGVVFVATASVALPIPYLLIVARAGSYLDPIMIALIAGVAGTLGEMAGYLIGLGGSGLVPHGRWYERARQWICGSGFWCIALFAGVPNPFFDAIGVAAGTLRYSWWRFALACFLGKALKFLVAALVGVEIAQRGWLH